MVIVVRPHQNTVHYDLGGLTFEIRDSFEDAFEYLHVLVLAGNQFVIEVPLPASPEEPYDLVGIVAAGRIQQYLYSQGANNRVLYEDSPFRT